MIKSLVSLKPLEKFPEKFLEITESFLVLCQTIVSFSFSLFLFLCLIYPALLIYLIYSSTLIYSFHLLTSIQLRISYIKSNYFQK